MTKFLKLFNYSGSKHYFVNDVKFLLQGNKYEVYYELFVGSGTLFFNVRDCFDEFVINDFSKDITNVYNFVKNYNFSDLENIEQEIKDKFGDIKNNKESYHKYKYFFNENIWKKGRDDEGGYFYFLLNSCYNSMPTFGSNGLSTGFGNRMYIVDQRKYETMKQRLKKTKILNKSYIDVEIVENSFVFLDPPYFKRPGPYSSNFKDNDYLIFLDFLRNLNSDFIYTDIDSSDLPEFKKIKLRTIQNSTYHKRVKNDDTVEVMYYNFKTKNKSTNQ